MDKNKLSNIYALYFISIANLLIMHYYIVNTCPESPLVLADYISNLGGVMFEVSIFMLITMAVLKGNVLASLLCCYILTLLWSFSNVLYSRYFGQYISISAIVDGGGESCKWFYAKMYFRRTKAV